MFLQEGSYRRACVAVVYRISSLQGSHCVAAAAGLLWALLSPGPSCPDLIPDLFCQPCFQRLGYHCLCASCSALHSIFAFLVCFVSLNFFSVLCSFWLFSFLLPFFSLRGRGSLLPTQTLPSAWASFRFLYFLTRKNFHSSFKTQIEFHHS